jgi:hypothetical protein
LAESSPLIGEAAATSPFPPAAELRHHAGGAEAHADDEEDAVDAVRDEAAR